MSNEGGEIVGANEPLPPGVSTVVECAPMHICRPWKEGDERRGMRAVDCMVPHCPHKLAVSPAHYSFEHQYICTFDARAYGWMPGDTTPTIGRK